MLKLTLLEKLFFVCITNTFCLIRRQSYKLLRKATNLPVKMFGKRKRMHAENNKRQVAARRATKIWRVALTISYYLLSLQR